VSTIEPTAPGLVIVRGGAATHGCISAYRERGDDLPITLVSDDDRRILREVADGQPVLVIGSGFVGWEVAASLRARGLEAAQGVVASGATTNIDVARTVGLVTDDAVEVDASMRTAAPGVYAAGDIVAALHPVAGRRLRVEHWATAERMGAVAGAVVAGAQAAWTQVPGFWSNIGGRQLKYVAWATATTRCWCGGRPTGSPSGTDATGSVPAS